jgi:hypothetical protein
MAVCTLSTLKAGKETFLAFTQRAVFATLGGGDDPLDAWIRQAEGCRTSKEKGDHFEALCVAYLRHPQGGGRRGIAAAWALADLPEEVRAAVGLPKRDFGIDIVARDGAGGFHAVQAKFKGRTNFRPSKFRRRLLVTWTELATFYALARRGPYVAHWVMTTANGITRPGGRCAQDRSVCYRGLKAMPRAFWYDVAEMRGRTCADALGASPVPPTPAGLRALRIARFDQKTQEPAELANSDPIWAELGL